MNIWRLKNIQLNYCCINVYKFKVFYWDIGNLIGVMFLKKVDFIYFSSFQLLKIVNYEWSFLRFVIIYVGIVVGLIFCRFCVGNYS